MVRMISIHVLREEDDRPERRYQQRRDAISIHVLREEDDYSHAPAIYLDVEFQSTSSARRTTAAW